MPWLTPTSEAALQQCLADAPALLVLFGGAHCGVCTALRPRIEALVQQEFAGRLALAAVDCSAPAARALCAQQGVFTVPVLRLYVNGRPALDWARHFSLQAVGAALARQLPPPGSDSSSSGSGSEGVPSAPRPGSSP